MSEAVTSIPASQRTSRPAAWWGMVLLIATEATLFLLLVATYFDLRHEWGGAWPPAPLSDPKIVRPLLAMLMLVASSAPMIVATRSARAGRLRLVRIGLALALLLALGFLAFEGLLIADALDLYRPQDSAYASIFYTLIGVHYVHTVAGVLAAVWALLRSRRFTPERHLTLRVTSLYWHFVNAVSVVVFLTLYIGPRA